jgi:pyruvate/2-oxoglutarate dehydrogenase complex dihydrolipoamide acyltransferase (E2) component
VKVPTLGDSIRDATLTKWLKSQFVFSHIPIPISSIHSQLLKFVCFAAEGDFVEADELICVVESAKLNADIRAPNTGKLTSRLAKEGDTIEVGAILAKIDTSVKVCFV